MRNIITAFLLIVIICNTLSSCKKNSDNIDHRTYLITNQSWTISSIRQNINNSGWNDIFSNLPICEKDDKLFFRSGGSYNWDSGSIKCGNSDPQTYEYGTWLFSSNETKLITTNPSGISSKADISLLDDFNLITLNTYISGTDTTITEAKYIH